MINSTERWTGGAINPDKPNCERCKAGSEQEASILKDIEDLKALHPKLAEYMGLTSHARDAFLKAEEMAENEVKAKALLEEDEGLEVAKKAYQKLAQLLPSGLEIFDAGFGAEKPQE